MKAPPSDDQQFTALQAKVDEWCCAGAMHHYRHSELTPELLGCREMIRVRVCVDEIPNAQTIPCGQREVAVNLAEFRVDQRRGAGILAADDIGPAAAGGHCFEYH
jgi:hypothetical protein